MDSEQLSGAVGCRDHLLKLFAVQRDRLFADDVLSRLKRADDNVLVTVVRNGDRDKVNAPVLKHRLKGRICLYSVCLGFRTLLRVDIIYAGKTDNIALLRMGAVKSAAHTAVADDYKLFLF